LFRSLSYLSAEFWYGLDGLQLAMAAVSAAGSQRAKVPEFGLYTPRTPTRQLERTYAWRLSTVMSLAREHKLEEMQNELNRIK